MMGNESEGTAKQKKKKVGNSVTSKIFFFNLSELILNYMCLY